MATIQEHLDDAERRQLHSDEGRRVRDEVDALQEVLEAMGVPQVSIRFAQYTYLEELSPDRLRTFLTYERERFEQMDPDDANWRSVGDRITSGFAMLARAGT